MKNFLLIAIFSLFFYVEPAQSQSETEQLLACAKSGQLICQLELGKSYAAGDDVPQDFDKALYWLKQKPSEDMGYGPNAFAIELIDAIEKYKNSKDPESLKFLEEEVGYNPNQKAQKVIIPETEKSTKQELKDKNSSFDINTAHPVELTEQDLSQGDKNIEESARRDISAFINGQRNVFSTKDHPKAKGAHFTIYYPSSWIAGEGERPNVVQKFINQNSLGLESVMIIVKAIPPDMVPTKKEREEALSSESLKDFLSPNETLISAESTKLEGEPAGIIEYKMPVERLGVKHLIHAQAIVFFCNEALVTVQFMAGGLGESEETVEYRMKSYSPLFLLMAQSVVFPDKWNDASSAVPKEKGSFLDMTSVDLLISFIVTWGIGLSPALLIRYVFLRRPLSSRTASWIAGSFSVIFWIMFRGIEASMGGRPGTGFVWFIIFYVARWIMSREEDLFTTNQKNSPSSRTPIDD